MRRQCRRQRQGRGEGEGEEDGAGGSRSGFWGARGTWCMRRRGGWRRRKGKMEVLERKAVLKVE